MFTPPTNLSMQHHWYSPVVKTALACLIIEVVLLALLWAITRSLIASAIWQIVLFGPPSIFFAPWLYKRFKSQQKEPS